MNKRERCKIYKEILIDIQTNHSYSSKRYWDYPGICIYLIDKAIHCEIDDLIELVAQKPKRSGHHSYWWEPQAKPGRIKALKAAIELCKPNKKNEKRTFISYSKLY